MNQNYCSSCGTKIVPNAKFCPNCGEKIETVVAETTKKKQSTEVKKTVSSWTNSYIILSFSLIFALLVIYFVLDSNEKALQQKAGPVQGPNQPQQEQLTQMMEGILKIKSELEADPNNYSLLVQMANANFDIGRFKEAISYYKKATSVNSTEPSVLIDLGVAYFNINKPDSALIYMNDALKIDPTNPQGLYNTGIVHFNQGDSLKAIAQWERLLETNSNSPQAEAAKKFIEKLKSELTKS